MTLYFKFPQSPEKSLYFRALAPFSPAVKRAEGPRIDEVACRAEFSRSHGPMPRRNAPARSARAPMARSNPS